MVFWLFAIAITVIVCAALYYAAAGRTVNAATAVGAEATSAHFRLQLTEIETDIASGRLGPAEGVAAKAELARELLRQQREDSKRGSAKKLNGALVMPASIVVVAALAFVTYAFLGSPNLPSQPFATRPDEAASDIDLGKAIKTVEARLATHPEDLKGWQVIAPVYMQSGQYALAEHAFRQILALSPPTADSETNLAEALMMQSGGQMSAEATALLQKAIELDPKQVRPRFYLAADATRQKNYASAVQQWNAVIAMGTDADGWMPTAKAGLAAAEAGRDGKPLPETAPDAMAAASSSPAQSPAIVSMVNGLADRLAKNGGPLADWTRLVRSEIVLGDLTKAQSAYDSARKAYPQASDREELDGLAAQAGLKIDGSSP